MAQLIVKVQCYKINEWTNETDEGVRKSQEVKLKSIRDNILKIENKKLDPISKLDTHKAWWDLCNSPKKMCSWTESCSLKIQQQMPCCFSLSSLLEILLCSSCFLRTLVDHLIFWITDPLVFYFFLAKF